MGGEVLYVETSKMEGEGKVTLTGQLGEVMKESANLALTWLRSHSSVDMKRDLIEKTDVHVHFPAGAVSKDGPSAGITVLVALASLFTNRCVRSDTAMTGEVTLRGLLLPVRSFYSLPPTFKTQLHYRLVVSEIKSSPPTEPVFAVSYCRKETRKTSSTFRKK